MSRNIFEYHSPGSIASACELLASLGDSAQVIAGGTDLIADLKQGLLGPRHLVSLARIPGLQEISVREDGIYLGPLVTPNMLAASDLLRRAFPALTEAGDAMAGNQIRNLATLGGNLCSAVPSADLPPSLLTVEAALELQSLHGARRLPLEEFFLGPRRTAIRAGEILTAIFFKPLPPPTGTAYLKFQLRGASALAVVGIAVRMSLQGEKMSRVLIAVGAAAPTPRIIARAGKLLEGREPTAAAFAEAAQVVAAEARPISDLRGQEQYRRDLAAVLTRRALKTAGERARSEPGA